MTTEWKLVPVEPTTEQKLAVCMHPDLAVSLYRSMINAAPVPPAGGEVEVLGYAARRNGNVGCWLHRSESAARTHDSTAIDCKPAGSEIVELVDRTHVTRLQAESVTNIMLDIVPGEDGMGEEVYAKSVADIQAKLSRMGYCIEDLETERDALKAEVGSVRQVLEATRDARDAAQYAGAEAQSELTKARELLSHMQTYSNKFPTSPIAEYKNQIAEVLGRQSAPAAKYDCCANCMRPKAEHEDNRCPAPYTTVWNAWDYEFSPAAKDGE